MDVAFSRSSQDVHSDEPVWHSATRDRHRPARLDSDRQQPAYERITRSECELMAPVGPELD